MTQSVRLKRIAAIHKHRNLLAHAPERLHEEITADYTDMIYAATLNRAALDRHAVPDDGDGLVEPRRAVDDEELGPSQTALDEIVEDGAPGLGALAAHALDREQHLLAVLAYAKDDKERDRQEIEARRKAFIRKWRLKHRAVADSLEEAGDRLFTFARLPPSQWRSARTTNAIERLHEEFKRRIKTQTVLPSADTAAMLFWALLASGQINMRKIDGWQTLATKPIDQPIEGFVKAGETLGCQIGRAFSWSTVIRGSCLLSVGGSTSPCHHKHRSGGNPFRREYCSFRR